MGDQQWRYPERYTNSHRSGGGDSYTNDNDSYLDIDGYEDQWRQSAPQPTRRNPAQKPPRRPSGASSASASYPAADSDPAFDAEDIEGAQGSDGQQSTALTTTSQHQQLLPQLREQAHEHVQRQMDFVGQYVEPMDMMDWDDAWSLEDEEDGEDEEDSARSQLAQPFPIWLSALFFVVALALLALVFVVAEGVAHADWADGARAVGFAALALTLCTAIGANVRTRLGRHAFSTILLSTLMCAVLGASGVGGLLARGAIRAYQAHTLEQHGQWTAAIHEYTLAGEKAPNAPDIARVYTEWGESELHGHSYAQAAPLFAKVVQHYPQSGGAVEQARRDLYTTYSDWLQSGGANIPYGDLAAAFVAYSQDPICDSSCQSDLHGKIATAYYAEGQQQLSAKCETAIPTYQTLAQSYGDTPEGALAKKALAASQSVSGTLTNFPSKPFPTLFLSKSANPSKFSFSDNYKTGIDSKTGNFTFKGVAPGNYNLSGERDLSSKFEYVYFKGTDGNLYNIIIQPLCPTQIGSFTYGSS